MTAPNSRRAALARLAALGVVVTPAGAASARPGNTVEVPIAALHRIAELLEDAQAGQMRAVQGVRMIGDLLRGEATPEQANALLG